jgi:hypothetical protein
MELNVFLNCLKHKKMFEEKMNFFSFLGNVKNIEERFHRKISKCVYV